MDWILTLTIVATLVGVIAGIVQVVQYFQDRKKKTLEKELSANVPVNISSSNHDLPPSTELEEPRGDEKSHIRREYDARVFKVTCFA